MVVQLKGAPVRRVEHWPYLITVIGIPILIGLAGRSVSELIAYSAAASFALATCEIVSTKLKAQVAQILAAHLAIWFVVISVVGGFAYLLGRLGLLLAQ